MLRSDGQGAPGSWPHLRRPVLSGLLTAASARRICAVVAAAGWGKTAAVRSWPLPSSAVRLDRHPADTGYVVQQLWRALGEPAGLPDSQLAATDPAGYGAAVCDVLAEWLPSDLALVFDDFHELPPDGAAVRVVQAMCQHAPDRLHLVLLSRTELPFSLTRLDGQGMVAELGAADLGFGVDEIAELLGAGERRSAELAAWLWQLTDGWPAVVHRVLAATRATGLKPGADGLASLVRPGERLHDYLRAEVLGAEPEPVLRLLRWLAVSGPATSDTAAAVVSPPAAQPLADLTRRGLLRQLTGQPGRWSLVAPLRAYFDQEQAIPAGERAALHSLAVAECTGRGAIADALRHCAAAGDHDTRIALLTEHGADLINAGHPDAVLAAADLPAALLADPHLQRLLGQAHQVRGQWSGAQECFRRAGHGQDRLDPALAWRIGMIAYHRGDFDEVLHLHERTRLDDQSTPDQARLLALLAAARRMVGDYAGSRADADRAVAIAQRCADPSALAAGHTVLSALATAHGDLGAADEHRVAALAAAEAGNDLLQVLRLRVQWAAALSETGQPRQALTVAETAVELGHRCQDVLLLAQALTARATARLRLGMLGRASADFEAARDGLQRIGSRLLAWPLCGLGDVHRIRGQLARARAAYEEALSLAEGSRDVLGLGWALSGLARVRSADDPAAAQLLAERAVQLGEGSRLVSALLARGWVAAVCGNRQAATADATLAAAAARRRRDSPGLAEALVLGALCSRQEAPRDRALVEAVYLWQEAGCRVQEATTLLVAGRLGCAAPQLGPQRGAVSAAQTLRAHDIELRSPRPAGPLAVLAGAAPSVAICALGVFQVARDGLPVPRTEWRSRKARQLLKILVAHRRRPMPREQLMELLWPEADPVRAGNRLSVLLSALRDVLQPGQQHADPGPLVTEGGAVWLDLAAVDVDVERFLQQAELALDAHRQRRDDAAARLVSAEAAHTGELFEDDPYLEWAAPLAEEVRAAHIALLRALVQRLRRVSETDDMVRYTLRLLDKDRYDEQVHLDLVDALLAVGRHGEARRRYQLYARAMSELGIAAQAFEVSLRTRRRPGSRP